jgi:hypothetical protein
MKIVNKQISDLIGAEYNPRELTEKQHQDLKDSLKRFGVVDPVLVNINPERHNIIIGGHQRTRVWEELGNTEIPCVELDLTLDQEKELNVRLNKNTGQFDFDMLANYFDQDELIEWGFDETELDFEIEPMDGDGSSEAQRGKLTDKFIIPPFTVLDTKQGYWMQRKAMWKEMIGDNGESREGTLSESQLMGDINNGVSILDPVMAEIANRWFCTEKGKTFDCFAGDSVFGYVSDALGNTFTGVELRQEQADLNNARLKGSKSKYICDDGRNVLKHIKPNSQDMLFSCPPYFDLEVYSDLPNDASNQESYEDFIKILRDAFTDAVICLKENRFAFIVVGDIRNKNGAYYRFHDHVKDIFTDAGMVLYNEMVLCEPLGTLPQRVGRYMNNRKIGKCHQNIFVFYKGDMSKIKSEFNEIDFTDLEDESANV